MIAHATEPTTASYRGPERRRAAGLEWRGVERWPWLLAFLGVALAMSGAAAAYWRAEMGEVKVDAYARLEAIGGSKVRELQALQRQHRIDVTRLAREAQALLTLEARGQPEARRWLHRRLEFELANGTYTDAWILDERGQIVAESSRSGQRPETAADQWRQATGERGGAVGPMRTDDAGSTYADAVSVIRDAQGRTMGYAQLRYDVAARIGPLLAHWPGTSGEGAALLAQPETTQVILLAGATDPTQGPVIARLDLTRDDVTAVQAVRSNRTRLEGLDYTGRAVLATAHPVPESTWSVVSRLDRAQVDAVAIGRARDILATLAGLLIGTALATAALYRREQSRLIAQWGTQASANAAFIRAVLDSLTEHLAVLDAEGRIIAVNEAWRAFGRANGAPAESSHGLGVHYIDACMSAGTPVPDDGAAATADPADPAEPRASRDTDGPTIARGIRDVLAGRIPSYTAEYPCDSPVQPRWFAMRVSPLAGGAGGAVVVHENITERRLAQLEAAAHAQRMAQVVAALPAAVYTCSADGTLTLYNEAAAQLWGRRPVLGIERWRGAARVLDDDGNDVEPSAGGMGQALRSGQPVANREYTLFRPDGERRVVESHAVPFVDALGRTVGGLNMLIDLTERRAMEQALRRSLAEKEALLKEVHHRVKNNLQVVSSLLRLEAQRVDSPAAAHTLRSVQDRVHAMALLHESLYRSSDLAHLDLPRYLNELIARLLRAHAPAGAPVRLDFDAQAASLPLDQAVPCGLIVNELASNALRHAMSPGAAGTLRLTLQVQPAADTNGTELVLQVADDGPGLPDDLAARRAGSLGLHLVDDLARQLGATLTVRTGPRTALGRGTEYELRVPYRHTPAAGAGASAPAAGTAPRAAEEVR